jgi:hypothetical protein
MNGIRSKARFIPKIRFRQRSRHGPCSIVPGVGIGPRRGGRIDGMHWVRIGGRFGTERAHGSGLPPVPLSHLRQAVQRAECGSLSRTQYPSDVIALVVLWRLRYKLALRDRPEMFLIRGIVFSHEAVRDGEAKLAPALAESLRRRRRGKAGCSWYIDET